ncbi:hypothetical protein ABFS83_07G033700 [Erythranthe nasuta]
MKTFFKSQGLWEIVDEGFTTPSDTSKLSQVEKDKLAKDMEKDNLALYNIQMAMADSIFPRICGATSAKEAWDTLKDEFQGNAKVRTTKLQTLRRANGEDISDKRVVEKILISLPEKYDPIVTTTELVGFLEAYEKRLSRRESDSMENAFQSKLKIRSQNSRYKERKFGESSKDCRSRQSHQTNFTEQDERKDYLFYACHAASEVKNDTWYIDSGCSNHMTSNEEIFQDIDKSMKTKVKLGNGALVEAEGLGTIAVNTKKGTRLI